MSYSSVANYSGSVPDKNQQTKNFVYSSPRNQGVWKNTSYSSVPLTPVPGAEPPLNTTLLTPAVIKTPSNVPIPVYIPTDLYVSGIIYGTLVTPSDEKLKDNIQNIPEMKIHSISNLEPKEFSYKYDPEKTHYGFLAQDVEKIYPELINENNNYKSVNYIELIPLLVSKINAMQKEIDDLKKQNNNI
jgi:hypothetical protein